VDEQLWFWIAGASGLFCLARGIADLRARRFVWGGLGVLAGLGLMLTPVESHAIKLDVVAPAAR